MLGIIKFYGFRLLLCGLLFSPAPFAAQDLGSSSGLFRPSNRAAKRGTPSARKKSAKPKVAAARKIIPTKAGEKTGARARSNPKIAELKIARNKPVQISARQPASPPVATDVIIKVGEPIPTRVKKPLTGNVEEAYRRIVAEGNMARARRNYRLAEAAYRRARRLKPADARAVFSLGNIFGDQKRWVQAADTYRQAISLDESNPEIYVALSLVLMQPVAGASMLERYAEAEKVLEKSIEVSPHNFVSYALLSLLYTRQGKFDEAEKTLTNALPIVRAKDRKRLAAGFEVVGDGLLKTDRKPDAARVYQQAITLTDGNGNKAALTLKLNQAQKSF